MLKNIKKLTQFTQNLKILYVEDNTEAREQTVKMLNNFFTNIFIGIDGKDGLDKFDQHKDSLDLIITDINMPNMNGIEMLEHIRKIDTYIPCIVLSAYNETGFFIDTISLGVDGYILKPINIQHFITILTKTVQQITLRNENLKYKNELENIVQEQVKKIIEKEKLLEHHTKLAAMGEMIDAIAHQWKQPLSIITTITSGMGVKFEMNMPVNKEDIINCSNIVQEQSAHLSDTIDEFRSFFRPNSNKTETSIVKVINSTIELLKNPIKKSTININVDCDENIKINIIPNEFKHIFINLINNTIDAFEEQENQVDIKNIDIKVIQDENKTIINFIDNAGGIPNNIIDTLFNANITTKEEGKGTGIGLYMSKQIIEKNNGTISVLNNNNGAVFKLEIFN